MYNKPSAAIYCANERSKVSPLMIIEGSHNLIYYTTFLVYNLDSSYGMDSLWIDSRVRPTISNIMIWQLIH